MADGPKNQTNDTEPNDPKNAESQQDDAPKADDAETVEPDADKSFTQKDVDRILSERLGREQRRMREELEREREKARKEAEEARLLEQENYKELAEVKAKEAEEARQRLDRYERDQKIDSLLDKHDITTPALRKLLRSVEGELSDLDEHVQGLKPLIQAEAERMVNERLATNPPPKGNEPEKPKPLKQQYDEAVRAGRMDEAMQISAKFEEEKRKAMRGG